MKTHQPLKSDKLSILSLTGYILLTLASVSTVLASPPIIVRASVSSYGEEGNGDSSLPKLSANGRFVAFASYADNLVPGDTNNRSDIFVRDITTGRTKRVSLNSKGKQAKINNCNVYKDFSGCGNAYPVISASGRYVAFESDLPGLVPEDTNRTREVFLRDIETGVTKRISVNSNGDEGDYYSWEPAISSNGRLVAFSSLASNLVSDDYNNAQDIFVHNPISKVTIRVSVNSEGIEGNGGSEDPGFSANGRFIAFSSSSSNLVAGDNNNEADVFVRNLQTGETKRASVSSEGVEGNSQSVLPSLSADGRLVAFTSFSSNLVAGDNNDAFDVFVHDLQTGITKRVSVSSEGVEGNFHSAGQSISANGRFVAFLSQASNLVTGDTGLQDVFVHDLKTSVTKRVSINNQWQPGNRNSVGVAPSISSNGRYVAFASGSSNLVENDHNLHEDTPVVGYDPGCQYTCGLDVFVRRW